MVSLRREQALRAAVAGLFSLVCACGTKGPTPGESAAAAGSAGTSGGNAAMGGGAGGAATGGAPAGGNGGSAGGAGTPAGGSSGSVGGGGVSAGGRSGSAGAAGTAPAGGNAGTSSSGTAGNAGDGGTLVLTSPAFENVPGCSVENPGPCAVFPDENVSYMDNANISPELRWSGVPAGTQSFAIVLFDVTFGQAHWVLWNIPADVTLLGANVPQDTAMPATPAGSQQANANFATTGGDGYFGPHLPCNVFQFELYALSIGTFSPMEPESAVLVSIELQELRDPVLGVAKLTGRSNDYMMACE